MLWGDNAAFVPRDVPIASILSCLQMVLGLPPSAPPRTKPRSPNEPHSSVTVDLESWLAFCLLALPMFGGEPPPELEAALPPARRMLLTLSLVHSGDQRPETIEMLEASRRELRRLIQLAKVDPLPEEIRRQLEIEDGENPEP